MIELESPPIDGDENDRLVGYLDRLVADLNYVIDVFDAEISALEEKIGKDG